MNKSVYVDPDVQKLLKRQQSEGYTPYGDTSIEGARERFRNLAKTRRARSEVTQVHKTWDDKIDSDETSIPVRYYLPSEEQDLPIVMYLHGGGWSMGSIETHDEQARSLCVGANALVCSVDYRLAPENPFPAAFNDCITVVRYLKKHGRDLGGNPDRVAVGGDSAGGNLSAAVALAEKDAEDGGVFAQLLNYGSLDHIRTYEDWVPPAEGLTIDSKSLAWFRGMYTQDEEQRRDPRVSPIYAKDFSGLPPTVISLAEHDTATEQGLEYAKLLEDAGVDVTVLVAPGQIHGFFMYKDVVPAAAEAARKTYEAFSALLRRDS